MRNAFLIISKIVNKTIADSDKKVLLIAIIFLSIASSYYNTSSHPINHLSYTHGSHSNTSSCTINHLSCTHGSHSNTSSCIINHLSGTHGHKLVYSEYAIYVYTFVFFYFFIIVKVELLLKW